MRRPGTDGSTVWISSKYSYTVLCCTVPGLRVGESSTVRAYYSTVQHYPTPYEPALLVHPRALWTLWPSISIARTCGSALHLPPRSAVRRQSQRSSAAREITQTHRHTDTGSPDLPEQHRSKAIMGQRKGVMARRRSCFRSGVMHVCKLVRGIGHGLGSGLDFCARLLGWGTADGTR